MTQIYPYAFPLFVPSDSRVGPSVESGMTLRDYFAGQALAGMLANQGVVCGNKHEQLLCARFSYGLADAMLAERERAVRS